LFALIYGLLGESLIALLTNLPEVRLLAAEYLPWLIFLPLISVWSYVFDGVFIGATLGRQMRDSMIISLLVFLLSCWLLADWGNHGLWLAMSIFMAVRGISMGIYWRSYLLRTSPL
jgi:MATE family multidrug resistance protein